MGWLWQNDSEAVVTAYLIVDQARAHTYSDFDLLPVFGPPSEYHGPCDPNTYQKVCSTEETVVLAYCNEVTKSVIKHDCNAPVLRVALLVVFVTRLQLRHMKVINASVSTTVRCQMTTVKEGCIPTVRAVLQTPVTGKKMVGVTSCVKLNTQMISLMILWIVRLRGRQGRQGRGRDRAGQDQGGADQGRGLFDINSCLGCWAA